MCGISAVVDPSARPESVATLRRMHEPIRHRGPDGEGFLTLDRAGRAARTDLAPAAAPPGPLLGLAFRRLRILDLSEAAAQPMASPDGALWIVFNGEVYNFRELRRELAAAGRAFRSTGDTEVVLAAFERWGEACFERLEGMWAAIVVDLRRRRLVGSRDRFGIKPLHWALAGGRLLLASEAKQILRGVGDRPRAHDALVSLFLRGARLPCLDETFFEGVRCVPPGTWFETPLDGPASPLRFRRYWDLSVFRCAEPGAFALAYPQAVQELRERLELALVSHSVSDVGVGSLLSGGLDSSVLVALLAALERRQGRSSPTFSFGFRGAAAGLDELPYVDALVRRDGLVNHETSLDAAWVAASSPRVVRALEEPPLAMAALAQYRVFGLCRAHGATVVLDGQGADEILGGYPYHQRTLLLDRFGHGRLRAAWKELTAIARRQGCGPLDVLAGLVLKPAASRLALRPTPWLDREFGRHDSLRVGELARIDSNGDPSRVNRRLHFDVKWGNARVILGYADRSAMAQSIEARVPYFDRSLVEFAFSLPDDYKVGSGESKRLLRDVARVFLPRQITERADRAGFAVPERALMRQGVWEAARERVLDPSFLAAPCLVAQGVRKLAASFEAGDDGAARPLWRLYALALWREEFEVPLS